VTDDAARAATDGAPKDGLPSALRFATELVAWVATPWWLSGTSWVLAVASLVVLIGLPTVFSTRGDKAQVIVAVPGYVTIGLVLLQLAAAVVSAWALWPVWAAVSVSVLAAATLVTEQPRWRRLARQP
jgi:heme A synthase